MAKRKIGELYNKPIVEGDKNLVKDYEIHVDELSGGGSDWLYLDASQKNYKNFKDCGWLFHIVTVGEGIVDNISSWTTDGGLTAAGPVVGVGICLSALIDNGYSGNKLMTIKELLYTIEPSFGVTFKDAILNTCNLKEITKEEFLSLQSIPN